MGEAKTSAVVAPNAAFDLELAEGDAHCGCRQCALCGDLIRAQRASFEYSQDPGARAAGRIAGRRVAGLCGLPCVKPREGLGRRPQGGEDVVCRLAERRSLSQQSVRCGAEAAARLTGRTPFVTLDSLRMAKHRMYYSDARARRELGYVSRPYREGLADAILWFREAGYLT